jgi:cell division protein FtsX
MPTVATVNGVDTVVRNSSAQVTLNIHADSTLQERKDLLAYIANFLGVAGVKISEQNLEPYY